MTIKYVAIPVAALFDKRVTPQQLRTLCIIAYYGSLSSKEAYPSYNRLAADVGITRRVIIGYIRHLVELGHLVKRERMRPNGSRTSNVYQVPLNIEIAPDEAVEIPVETSGGVVLLDSTTPSATGQHQGGATGQHPQSHTPNEEKKKNTIKKGSQELVTLAQWEEANGGPLRIQMMVSWVKDHSLNPVEVRKLIEEFREARQANEILYVDYAAAFKNHLRRGFLSRTMEQIVLRDDISSKATLFDRGLSL